LSFPPNFAPHTPPPPHQNYSKFKNKNLKPKWRTQKKKKKKGGCRNTWLLTSHFVSHVRRLQCMALQWCYSATLNQAVTLLLQPRLPQAFLQRSRVSVPLMASTSYLLHLFTCSILKWHPFCASFKCLFLLSNTHKYTSCTSGLCNTTTRVCCLDQPSSGRALIHKKSKWERPLLTNSR